MFFRMVLFVWEFLMDLARGGQISYPPQASPSQEFFGGYVRGRRAIKARVSLIGTRTDCHVIGD